jgi:hypothetical protein
MKSALLLLITTCSVFAADTVPHRIIDGKFIDLSEVYAWQKLPPEARPARPLPAWRFVTVINDFKREAGLVICIATILPDSVKRGQKAVRKTIAIRNEPNYLISHGAILLLDAQQVHKSKMPGGEITMPIYDYGVAAP